MATVQREYAGRLPAEIWKITAEEWCGKRAELSGRTTLIRRARCEESDFLTELTLRSKAHWGYDDAFLTAVRDELEFRLDKFHPDFHVYILEQEGERAGFCSLLHIDRETVELHDLFLEPKHIGKGYGKQMWSYAVSLARDLGYQKLTLISEPYAEPFYARRGAVRTGEKTSTSIPGRKLPVMEYSLVAGDGRDL